MTKGIDAIASGDHVRARRNGYWHHGIDCGDGAVIHYSGELLHHKNAYVQRIGMAGFSKGGRIEVVPYSLCSDPDTVLKRAESRLRENAYHLLTNNCEHFARWCKTVRSESPQILRALHAASVVCVAVGTLIVGVATAKWAAGSRVS